MKYSPFAIALLTSATAWGGTFSSVTITGDGDSGISGDTAYTHAIDIFDGANRTINGAVFTGSGGFGNPATNNYSTGGLNNGFTGNVSGVSGSTGGLMNNFLYNGNPSSYTLHNLRIGQTYTTSFINSAFGAPGGRIHNITTSDGGSILNYDQNASVGSVLKYTFTAASNSITYTLTPQNPGDTWHHYGFSNEIATYTALLTDNFYAPGNVPTENLNGNLAARQGGSIVTNSGTVAWVGAGNTQVGNATGGIDNGNYLLNAFGGTSALDYNFNGSAAQNGMSISFDLAPNVGNVGSDNWQALNLGASSGDKNGGVNGGHEHFGILFRGAGTIQAFDANSLVSGGVEPTWGPGGVTTALNHFELLITDPTDGNPFDGVGQTTIDVFANGNPVYSFTKGGGGYDQNYINFQASHIGGIDNLLIAQIPEPAVAALGGIALLGLARRRREK